MDGRRRDRQKERMRGVRKVGEKRKKNRRGRGNFQGKTASCDSMGDGPVVKKGKKEKRVGYCECKLGEGCTRPSHWHRKEKRKKDGFAKRVADKAKNKKEVPMRRCTEEHCENLACHYHAMSAGPWSKRSEDELEEDVGWGTCNDMLEAVNVKLPEPVVGGFTPVIQPAQIPTTRFPLVFAGAKFSTPTTTTNATTSLTVPHGTSPLAGEKASSLCTVATRDEDGTDNFQQDEPEPHPEIEEKSTAPKEETDCDDDDEEQDDDDDDDDEDDDDEEETDSEDDDEESDDDEPVMTPEEYVRSLTQPLPWKSIEEQNALVTEDKRIFANFTKGVQETPKDWIGIKNIPYHIHCFLTFGNAESIDYTPTRDLGAGVLENTLGIEASCAGRVKTNVIYRMLGGAEYVDQIVRDATATHFMEAYPHTYVAKVYTNLAEYVLADSNFRKYNTTDREGNINVNLEAAVNHTMNSHPASKLLATVNEATWVHTFNYIINRAYRQGLVKKATAIGWKPKNDSTGRLGMYAPTAQYTGCVR
jgi:hypothetical protein